MFLNLLKGEEKAAFLTLARRVISADSDIAQKEMTLLDSMKREMELEDELELKMAEGTIEQLCAVFSSSKSKVSALMELIGIGFVDGKFVHEEQEVIFEIARHMGISKEETTMYIDWARRVYVN
ncbi:MAG: hypothetical protein HC913_18080 [Microscillaceae bacterium]|nr:hypothetical protein [Microscillaceae bacterium]